MYSKHSYKIFKLEPDIKSKTHKFSMLTPKTQCVTLGVLQETFQHDKSFISEAATEKTNTQ